MEVLFGAVGWWVGIGGSSNSKIEKVSVVLGHSVAGSAHGCGVGERKWRFPVVLLCLAAGDHVFTSYPCLAAMPIAFSDLNLAFSYFKGNPGGNQVDGLPPALSLLQARTVHFL